MRTRKRDCLLVSWLAALAINPALGDQRVYEDFTQPTVTLNRTVWWRGGLAGVDGTNAILNESDLTSARMFLEGEFRFVIGGPSASSQGLFGLGDIDDGDPFLVLSDDGRGWRFHVRNGSSVHTGPVIASSLRKGDVVVFHWDSHGSSVSLNGLAKDAQTTVHPPRMPLTILEWNNTAKGGEIILDSVSYAVAAGAFSKLPAGNPVPSPRARMVSAKLEEDTFVDSSAPETPRNGSTERISIRNCRYHPDLTGAGTTVDSGCLGLVQFTLPQLPAGWKVAAAHLTGTVAQNHRLYGMPGWAPSRPVDLEVLGLAVDPDLAKVTYEALHDATGQGVITGYAAWGSVNFTFGEQARSLEVLQFETGGTPAGSLLQFPDRQGRLCAFVRSRISRTEPKRVTFAIGPGRTQAVSGMDCDFAFHAREDSAGGSAISLSLELEPEG